MHSAVQTCTRVQRGCALRDDSSSMVLFITVTPTYHAQQLGDKAEQLMANRQLLEKQPNRKGMSTALQVDDTIMKLLLSECGQTPSKTQKLQDEDVEAVLYHVMKRREEVEAYYRADDTASRSYEGDSYDADTASTAGSTMAATAPNVKLAAAAPSVISDRSRSSRSTASSSSRSRDGAAARSSSHSSTARPDSPAYSSSAESVIQQIRAASTTATAGTAGAAGTTAAAATAAAVLPRLCRPVPPPSLQSTTDTAAVPASHATPTAAASSNTGSARPVRPAAPQRVYADNNNNSTSFSATAGTNSAAAAPTGVALHAALPVQRQVSLLQRAASFILPLSACQLIA
jgi:hypothetical protein